MRYGVCSDLHCGSEISVSLSLKMWQFCWRKILQEKFRKSRTFFLESCYKSSNENLVRNLNNNKTQRRKPFRTYLLRTSSFVSGDNTALKLFDEEIFWKKIRFLIRLSSALWESFCKNLLFFFKKKVTNFLTNFS